MGPAALLPASALWLSRFIGCGSAPKARDPAGSLREDHAELELYFTGAMEPLLRLLGRAEQQGSGMGHFAVGA